MPVPKVRGFNELAKKMAAVSERIENPKGAVPSVGPLLQYRVGERFARQGEGDWPPLAPATVAAKARDGLDPRILHATGALELAMVSGRAYVTREGEFHYAPRRAPRYGYILMADRRPLLSDDESRLADRVNQTFAEYVMGALA